MSMQNGTLVWLRPVTIGGTLKVSVVAAEKLIFMLIQPGKKAPVK